MSTDEKKNEVDKLMAELHEEQCKALIKKIKSGEATAAELQAVTQFLKANGVTSEIHRDKNLAGVADALGGVDDEGNGTIDFTTEELGIDSDSKVVM